MSARCDDHDHDQADETLVAADIWHATTSHGAELGDFCTEHLGAGLDGLDGHVNLDRLDQL